MSVVKAPRPYDIARPDSTTLWQVLANSPTLRIPVLIINRA